MRYSFLISILIFIAFLLYNVVFSPTNAFVEYKFLEDELFLNSSANNTERENYIVTVTGYSSSIDETDDEPYITASGVYVKEGIVATNFLPIGTKIKIPSLFGDKVFVVHDRMNKRYYYRVDVWFPTKEEAKNFGIHYNVKIEILD